MVKIYRQILFECDGEVTLMMNNWTLERNWIRYSYFMPPPI